jgi:hemerythrin-like domain-containing protein
VLSAIDSAAKEEAPLSFYEAVVDFVVNFADGCHHDKEEGLSVLKISSAAASG